MALAVGHVVEEGLKAGRGGDRLAGFWRAIGLQVKTRLLHLRVDRWGTGQGHSFAFSYSFNPYAAPGYVRAGSVTPTFLMDWSTGSGCTGGSVDWVSTGGVAIDWLGSLFGVDCSL